MGRAFYGLWERDTYVPEGEVAVITFPRAVANQNVPEDVLILADVSSVSGEIHDTYYMDADGGLWVVCDWVGHKPRPAYKSQVLRLTGVPELVLNGMLQDRQRDGYWLWEE